jgi:hypothetical protein
MAFVAVYGNKYAQTGARHLDMPSRVREDLCVSDLLLMVEYKLPSFLSDVVSLSSLKGCFLSIPSSLVD